MTELSSIDQLRLSLARRRLQLDRERAAGRQAVTYSIDAMDALFAAIEALCEDYVRR